MKKIIVILLCSIICVAAVACNREYRYTYHQPKENIICITYVDEVTQVKIEPEKYDDLLEDIQELPCKKFWNDPVVVLSIPYIIIEYRDGEYETISAYLNYHGMDGEKKTDWLYFDGNSFSDVLNQYK